jgi:epoxyqueuosine reductase
MGNALASATVSKIDKAQMYQALSESLPAADSLVAEHIEWALKAYN